MDISAVIRTCFERLHRCPEPGFKEFETTKIINEVLSDNGIETVPWPLETGAMAIIRGGRPGPVIALRADIDALPVEEDTELPYKSEIPGMMHACGHDFHTACMLGTAILLNERRAELSGTVKVLFQPDEEKTTGARAVNAAGLVDDAEVFIAGHTYPGEEAGWIGIKAGPVMAAADFFSITLTGKGAHAAHPHVSIDPVPAVCALGLSLQTLVSRRVDPFSHAVVTVGHISAGTTNNVIPQTGLIEGTIRTLNANDRVMLRDELYRMAQSVAQAYNVKCDIDWLDGPAAVVNDEKLCEIARETAKAQGLTYGPARDTMGAEDFSMLKPGAPRLFVRVGTGGGYINHHPRFTADPAALVPAAEYMAALAARVLDSVR